VAAHPVLPPLFARPRKPDRGRSWPCWLGGSAEPCGPRVHLGARWGAGAARAAWCPRPETLARIRPGETTCDEVLRICGASPEEEARLPSGETRMLVYSRAAGGNHTGGRSFGWFGTVSRWDVEHHEVQIELDHDCVRDIQAPRPPPLGSGDPPPPSRPVRIPGAAPWLVICEAMRGVRRLTRDLVLPGVPRQQK